jgi:hypothetical protein
MANPPVRARMYVNRPAFRSTLSIAQNVPRFESDPDDCMVMGPPVASDGTTRVSRWGSLDYGVGLLHVD